MSIFRNRTFTAVIFGSFCGTNLFRPYNCSGKSMEPTLNHNRDGDIVLVEKLSCYFKWFSVGDIVIAMAHDDPKSLVCKRIHGMPGDIVVNPKTMKKTKVRPGHVWLCGDNSEVSHDSNIYGDIPMGLLLGRVYFRIWPLNDMKFL